MPYVKQETRAVLDSGTAPRGPGELNYALTKVIMRYWHADTPSYLKINDILGALEGAKAEFYRRVAVPYETQKCAENGEVYE